MIQEKKYHIRKLAIIKMIEECDERIKNELAFIKRFNLPQIMGVMKVSDTNISRYEKIKNYLLERYKN